MQGGESLERARRLLFCGNDGFPPLCGTGWLFADSPEVFLCGKFPLPARRGRRALQWACFNSRRFATVGVVRFRKCSCLLCHRANDSHVPEKLGVYFCHKLCYNKNTWCVFIPAAHPNCGPAGQVYAPIASGGFIPSIQQGRKPNRQITAVFLSTHGGAGSWAPGIAGVSFVAPFSP